MEEAPYMVETVKRYIGTFGEYDISVIEDIFDSDATIEDPAGSDPHVGLPAIREWFSNADSLNVNVELTGNVRCAGNIAAFPIYVTFDSGDSRMKIEAIDLFEFNENGKVQSVRAYWGPSNCTQL